MSNLYVTVGIPGAGKSTYAKKLLEEGVVDAVFSFDEYKDRLIKERGKKNITQVTFETIFSDIANALEEGKNCIYDSPNETISMRKKFLDYIKEIDCNRIAVIIPTPVEVALERNRSRDRVEPDFVIKTFHKKLRLPTLEEGFDEIRYIEE